VRPWFGGGVHIHDGVFLPGQAGSAITKATPQVYDKFAFNRYSHTRSDIASLFKIMSERIAYSAELLVAKPMYFRHADIP
jgi:hypothetical protein